MLLMKKIDVEANCELQRLELLKKIFKKILNGLKKSSLKGDSIVQTRRTLRFE